MENQQPVIIKGVFGSGSALIAATGTLLLLLLPQMEQWLRMTSMALGIVVALATLYSLLKKKK